MSKYSIAFLGGLILAAFVIVFLVGATTSIVYFFLFSSNNIPETLVYKLDSLAARLDSVEGVDGFIFQLPENYFLFSIFKGFTYSSDVFPSSLYPACEKNNCLCLWEFDTSWVYNTFYEGIMPEANKKGYCVVMDVGVAGKTGKQIYLNPSKPSYLEFKKSESDCNFYSMNVLVGTTPCVKLVN